MKVSNSNPPLMVATGSPATRIIRLVSLDFLSLFPDAGGEGEIVSGGEWGNGWSSVGFTHLCWVR